MEEMDENNEKKEDDVMENDSEKSKNKNSKSKNQENYKSGNDDNNDEMEESEIKENVNDPLLKKLKKRVNKILSIQEIEDTEEEENDEDIKNGNEAKDKGVEAIHLDKENKNEKVKDLKYETKVNQNTQIENENQVEEIEEDWTKENIIENRETIISQVNEMDFLNQNEEMEELQHILFQSKNINEIDKEMLIKSQYLWQLYELSTRDLSLRLCEQLRMILEPLVASRLQGDYKSGKRINMRKIIPYIASDYRKDKIWLRRTKPSKRNYQILIVLDDSKSMKDTKAGVMACKSLALLTKALNILEVGEIGVCSFGDTFNILHEIGKPFMGQSGELCLSKLTFSQERTNFNKCIPGIVSVLTECRINTSIQISFIISDGRINSDRNEIRKYCIDAVSRGQIIVMLIIDTNESSLVEATVWTKDNKLKPYMEDYPFPYYIIIRDLDNLPEVLGSCLKQWFEMISQNK